MSTQRINHLNLSRNSEDAPEWMSRTQQYFLRALGLQRKNNNSMYVNPEGSFMQTRQKWVYESTPQARNVSGQF